jgi:hypothetical protein
VFHDVLRPVAADNQRSGQASLVTLAALVNVQPEISINRTSSAGEFNDFLEPASVETTQASTKSLPALIKCNFD